jgi:hypothetical protein
LSVTNSTALTPSAVRAVFVWENAPCVTLKQSALGVPLGSE